MNLHKSRLVCKWELTYDVVNWDEVFESERNGIIISARWWSTVHWDIYSERNFLEHFWPNVVDCLILVSRTSDPMKQCLEVLEIQRPDEKESESWVEVYVESTVIWCSSKKVFASKHCFSILVWDRVFEESEVMIPSIVRFEYSGSIIEIDCIC